MNTASYKRISSDSDEEYYDAEEPSSFVDNKPASLSMSLIIGSDEVHEMFCEECEKHDNKYVPAEGFCVECVRYKCAICIRFHRSHHQNHSLQDKDNMPQDFYFEKCTKHPKELIKFYCGKCEKVACPECKRNDHRNCCNVEHLPKLVKNVECSKELKDIKENLDKVSKDIETIKIQIKSKTEIAYNLNSRAKATIKEHKDKLIGAYRKHQKEIIKQFDMEETIAKLKSERKKLIELIDQKQTKFEQNLMHSENDTVQKIETSQINLESLETKNTTWTNDLKQLSADLTQAEVSGQKCQLFLAMKDAQATLKILEKKILHLQSIDIQYYIIEPLNTEVSVKTLESQTTFFSYKDCNSTIGRIATFDIKIICRCGLFSCLCLLSENILVQTDCNTKCLKILINIHTNTVSYDSIKMSSSPRGITKIEDNKVAVTLPKEGIVRLLTFSDSMTVISTDDITVGEGCHGIAYSNNNLIVSYMTNLGKVQILDMSGNVLKCFDIDCNGQPLFSLPFRLTPSPDNTTIYVSDYDRGTVTSMTLDGKVKAIYRDHQLSGPRQLTVDESGTVYVCGLLSHNVHQLSSDLTKVKILLDQRQGMYHPVSVTYSQKNRRLYLGMWDSNIKVFNLSLK